MSPESPIVDIDVNHKKALPVAIAPKKTKRFPKGQSLSQSQISISKLSKIDYSRTSNSHTSPRNLGSPIPEEFNAFGSQCTREKDYGNDLPPPGNYFDPEKTSVLLNSPSISKVGYLNGFASKDLSQSSYIKRSLSLTVNAVGYNLPGAMDYSNNTMNRQGLIFPFLGSPKERIPYPDPKKSFTPGPSKYNIKHDIRGPPYIRNKKSWVFQSIEGRESMFIEELRKRYEHYLKLQIITFIFNLW